jgi:amylosucrase
MPHDLIARQADTTKARLFPRIEAQFASASDEWVEFKVRLDRHFPQLFRLLLTLYGTHYDFYYHLESILSTAAQMWLDRPAELKALDKQREADPRWFQSEKMAGGVCYIDLFAGDLRGLRSKIPSFKQLGLTYLHLMPLFRSPEGNSDGGYAVSSYRDVDPRLGTISDLTDLATELRRNGISLVLDFVFNHTSDEHEWAIRAQQGDPTYSDYYYIFPDRTLPDAYQRTLREIFPDQRPGSFTYRPDMDRWVWTTFNSFQWDLNYSNPAVFNSMAGEMLHLANRGAEILRLDALAFVWKEMGTDCENRPEAHLLIQAFNTVARIAAPALLFKSEAIVHPDRVIEYIGEHECQLSYNPLLMALLWEALATREVRLLALSMCEKFNIGDCCAWVNYVRSHDDIGWTFDDATAQRLGIDGYGHRRFLNDFYTGRFEGSFARGLPFGENPRTGDVRISGTTASLAGLEQAQHLSDKAGAEIEHAIGRILLIYGIVASIGGIPLIYLGDEIGTLNDYSYRDDPAKAADSRWVHRPRTDWQRVASAAKGEGVEGRIYSALLYLLDVRRATPALADGGMEVVDTANPHTFSFVRHHDAGRVLVLANFSETEQTIPANEARLYGLGYAFRDLLSGDTLNLHNDIELSPYKLMWLVPNDGET